MTFEWDEDKNRINIGKHGVSFETAMRIFEGPVLSWTDDRKEYGEVRRRSIGQVDGVVVLAVIHTNAQAKPELFPPVPPTAPKGTDMKKRYKKELGIKDLAAIKDEDIDYSDIPRLDERFWKNAKLIEPENTQQVTLRVKKSVLEAYKATGKGYQTRMNAVLESFARTLGKS